MAFIRHLLEYLLHPFFLCLLALGICIFLLYRRLSPAFTKVMLFVVLIVLLAMSTGWLPSYLTYQLESRYPIVKQVNPNVKWVVVLGGGQNIGEGMPANDLLTSASIKRLIEGVRLFRTLPDAKLLLSGGGSAGEQSEALLLTELTSWFAIDSEKVVIETASINTADQARELAAIVHDQPFYLVTSAIHMPRSMALCQQQGLHPIAAPTDFTFFWSTDTWVKLVIPNSYNLAYTSIALHEILGKIWVLGFR
ncbi:TPA: lpg2628 family Dot/Icm T4SS effector [Legionella pneumophila subsp. pneumophila]|uniref:lpg2628 family Dot/Icm T4SS effector n=1 Tax=Legionella pneumophila TaxID=446 RepID=UPI0007708565|nr:lpg2628 family Dot/Icm T4SS effector [Legionella pneumophila]HAT8849924.1 lpg2628 family Dot/Icm T4SS effector [Legionella pneumophila subsp. pneumophila]CZH55196.1 DUF218 domain [Legionella pneumophila]CZI51495.1 DUF218 domain [Legionella pneumophila]HAT9169010.1 lpg2628 family Dot/Icm T4SS effector [Legionella pneumophila subsp. pneumophila]HAT9584434.1 lpg2628 family Dot/Icm T4SS effector [Legionella pneumophila subsp. pneumophila]